MRIEVHRCRMPSQPDREACEVGVASRVLVASGLEITTDVHGRRWNAAPTRNCASVSVARLRWPVVQNAVPSRMNSGRLRWMMPLRCWMGSLRVRMYLGERWAYRVWVGAKSIGADCHHSPTVCKLNMLSKIRIDMAVGILVYYLP